MRPSWSPSAPAVTAARPCAARSPRPTSSPPPRRSATTGAGRGSTGRSSSARTPTRHRGPRSAPPPVISHSIVVYTHGRTAHLAEGIVVTPSHTPPEDGGFKYTPPGGGPADT